jgi:hypothetical protein
MLLSVVFIFYSEAQRHHKSGHIGKLNKIVRLKKAAINKEPCIKDIEIDTKQHTVKIL